MTQQKLNNAKSVGPKYEQQYSQSQCPLVWGLCLTGKQGRACKPKHIDSDYTAAYV